MHFWSRGRDVPSPCRKHKGNQSMLGKGKSGSKAAIPKDVEGSSKPQRKVGKPKQIIIQIHRKGITLLQNIEKCIKKSDFQWTAKAERTFQEMKQCINELPMLTALKPREELIMYLCAAREAISLVLLTERDSQQMAIYFVSHALQALKINYSPMEKLIMALVHAARRLRRYFQAHSVVVITD
ncbi:reverse transcriptase domain-containing protein [Tanacetum coccineum]